ncbi:MAG: hypothetical protein HY549_07360 [Elusimicrobia bacterium]|nr:hypothetical protein [Elusimicrobiota bacterium]
MSAGRSILADTSVVYMMLCLSLAAAVPLLMLCALASRQAAGVVGSAHLASELLEEIRLRRWDEDAPKRRASIDRPSRALGVDAGENPGDKRSFDDIDDFDGWAEAKALGPGMEELSGLESFRRSARIAYVDEFHPDSPAQSPTDLKRVISCAQRKGQAAVCLSTLLANR